ncbi:MAG: SIMPL domain-containing protein [Phascolarctobacterium sp.]|nr:SIMPL domain-containing protein [Phascolarctobacterium sp.]
MEVAPDLAYLRCNIVGKGTTAVEATVDAAQIINDVRHSLLGLNIVGEDIVNMSYDTHSMIKRVSLRATRPKPAYVSLFVS